jgi:putative nucleotidyltransferase with HDIG domain
MELDKQAARTAFRDYVRAYDPSNPRIALKISHTYRVADLSHRIAREEGLDADLSWLCGLLHDIGRFEQVRRFDTFNDAASVNHAAMGTHVLFGTADPRGPRIRDFIEDESEDALVATAIATHSDFRLPTNLDERTRAYANVLRDADKIDILKVNCINTAEEIYGVSEREMAESQLTDEVEQAFYEHRCIPRGIKKSPVDLVVGHVCFAYELVYPISLEIMLTQGHLQQILGRRFDDPETDRRFRSMGRHMMEWVGERVLH